MTDTTPRFALPHILPGQAQKELYHNEALTLVDALLHPAVEAVGADVPTGAPEPGQAWIVGGSPSGAWAGQADMLAFWTGGGWRYMAPRPGMTVHLASAGVDVRYDGATWVEGELTGHALVIDGDQVVGPRGAAIGDLGSGGDPVPVVNAILSALRAHGLIEN
ncbi:DUF2793 domain-containing protein [uncultured Parasphingopyxis sp.]|uniref:DUF2793 domain-containing protein n=1 Tax=uncultured Parasphingopyxis sp. TaxID=1547918 RepID=UPI00261C7E39|nr:DUF2793 domain-containing protein [uncultured Parasphingopyxis sp.]